MSLPPVTIHIKRKATDEPVEFLRKDCLYLLQHLPNTSIGVHEPNGKRQRRATDFVFSRQADFVSPTISSSPVPDTVRRIKQLPRGNSTPSLNTQNGSADAHENVGGNQESASQTQESTGPITPGFLSGSRQGPVSSSGVRRFHMSRSATPTASHTTIATGKIQKRVFVERRSRPGSSKGPNNLKDEALLKKIASTASSDTDTAIERPQKKPGLAARIPASRVQDAAANLAPTPPLSEPIRLPSGLLMPWDVNSEQLAAEMQAYTLQEIGRSLAQSEAAIPKVPEQRTPLKPTRFKPKKPALRYGERHPDEVHNDADMDVDEPMVYDDELDDSDYIIDTYIRMPAQDLDEVAQENFGLLILETQPDIDDFYQEDSDNEEQENDEEEDENG